MARRPNRQRNRPGTMYQDIFNPGMGGFVNRQLPYNPGVDNTTMMPGGKPGMGGMNNRPVLGGGFMGDPDYYKNPPGMGDVGVDNTTMMPGGKPGMGGMNNRPVLGGGFMGDIMSQTIGQPDGLVNRQLPYNPSVDNTTMMPGGKPGMGGMRTADLRPGDKFYDPAFSTQPGTGGMDRFIEMQPFQPQSPAAPQGVDLYGNPLGPVSGQNRNNTGGGMPNYRTQGPDNMPGMGGGMPQYQQLPYGSQGLGGFFGGMGGYGGGMPMMGGYGGGMPMMGGYGGGYGGGSPFGMPMMGGYGGGMGGYGGGSPFGAPMMGGGFPRGGIGGFFGNRGYM